MMYEKGIGVTQDCTEAARLYKLAADQGHARGQHNLGVVHFTGFGARQNFQEAMRHRLYTLAADQGHVDAQFKLAAMYQCGIGVAPNPDEARRWFDSAAAGPLRNTNRRRRHLMVQHQVRFR